MIDYSEMFIGLSGGEARAEGAPEERRRGLFRRLVENLSTSRKALTQQIATIAFDPADDAVWEELEEALLLADCGVPATVEIVGRLEAEAAAGGLRTSADLTAALRTIIADLLSGSESRIDVTARPTVILVVGVNGTGKTTTVGKLAEHVRRAGGTVVVGAADTFRAAAGEQLETWARRAGADFVGSVHGQDPAAVAYDAVAAGESRGRDVVIIDTAGRLHTQTNLMEELVQGAPRDHAAAARGAARDAARGRRHDGPERPAAGAPVRRRGAAHRRRPDEARRHRRRAASRSPSRTSWACRSS